MKIELGKQKTNGYLPAMYIGQEHKLHHYWIGIGLILIGIYLVWHDAKYHSNTGTLYKMFNHLR